MPIKLYLARKFPRFFESKQIKYLKSLGVDFHENDPNNFVSKAKLRKKNSKFEKKMNIQKLGFILKGSDKIY